MQLTQDTANLIETLARAYSFTPSTDAGAELLKRIEELAGDQVNAEILRLRTQLIRFAELVYIFRSGTPTEAEAQELVAIEGIWFGIHPEPNHSSNLAPSNVEFE